MTTSRIKVSFPGSHGVALAARLDLPAGPPRAYALFAHCFTCSKDVFAAGRIAAELNAHGIAVLRFDFTGLGASEGDFANTDFSSNLGDLRAAADWLRVHHRPAQLLIGHSLGGAAAVAVAADLPEVRAVVTIGAPADATHVTKLFVDDLPTIEASGRATVDIGGRPFTIRRELIDDLAGHSIEERAAALGSALLVLHSPVDAIVGVDNAARLYTAARHPKSFVSLDGADHLLSNRDDAVYAARVLATWAERYLVDDNPAAPIPARTAQVVVAETSQGTFLNHVVAGGHHLLADEPVDVGGFDAGPSPYDLLGAALGACTSMTLRLYADRKGLPLDRVRVEVRHRTAHAEDCEACVRGDGRAIDHFERTLHLEGDLDDDARAALARIADRCPVHRTLERSSHIATTVAAPPTRDGAR
ncbi:MAG TPA: bifunctional alpha/beta hydrolase/OsmC family protein [Acidimicrobiales bacterium]|nr:bifunctional alpha/beta hydrolase/OsmC family protein [Acidimicrobiales bacterium]